MTVVETTSPMSEGAVPTLGGPLSYIHWGPVFAGGACSCHRIGASHFCCRDWARGLVNGTYLARRFVCPVVSVRSLYCIGRAH